MRLLTVLGILVLAGSAAAQPFTLHDPAFLRHPTSSGSNVVAPPAFSPQSIPGLAYYWNYNDLTVGVNSTTWTDRVSGAVLAASYSPVPINAYLGVQFLNCNAMTNPGIAMNSNFSLWFVCKPVAQNSARSLLFGNFSSGAGLVLNNGVIDGDWSSDQNVGSAVPITQVYPNGACLDIVDSQGTIYTNAVKVAGSVGQPTNNFPFNGVGGNVFTGSTGSFDGYVEYIGIWTNTALTPANVASLDAWVNTNGVTNVTSGLIGWWRLNEGTGTTAFDSSGNGNNGTFAGTGLTWITGVIGDAISSAGTGQINTADTNFADNLSAMTASFWVRGTNWGPFSIQPQFLNKNGPGGSFSGQGWGFFSDSSFNIAAYTQDTNGGWIETPHNPQGPLVADGYWHFIACTFSGLNTLEMYIDAGAVTGPIVGPGGVTSTANNGVVVLGGDSENVELIGSLDDVRIYNRILSQQEILMLYRWRGQP
jgi:hypothetical protein